MGNAEKNKFEDEHLLLKMMKDHLVNKKDSNIKNFFFKSNNTEDFLNNIIKKTTKDIDKAINIRKYELDNNIFLPPYTPFIDIIKDGFKRMGLELNKDNLDKVFAKADVYYFHRKLLKSYLLEENITKRDDSIIYTKDELIYEKQEFYDALLSLIKYFAIDDQLSIYVIDNFHYLKNSSIDFLDYLLKHKQQGKIFFIYFFNEEYKYFEKDRKERWKRFLEKINKHDYFLEPKLIKEKEVSLKTNFASLEDVISPAKIKKNLEMSHKALKLLAVKEAKEYAKKSYDFLVMSDLKIENEQYFELLKLLGDIYFLLGEDNIALNYYNKLLNFANKSNDKRLLIISYQRVAIINLFKHSLKISQKYSKLSLKLAKELSDEALILKTEVVLFEIIKSLMLDHNHDIDKYMDFFKNFKQRYKNQYNLLIKIYQFFATTNEIELKKRLNYCEKGIKIAEKYKNKYLLSLLYHRKGIIYSALSKKESIDFYQKSKGLRLKIGAPYPIVKIYNGLGHAYFDKGEYLKAVNYFKKTFPYLKKLENSREVGSVCFNLALIYMFGQDYKKAIGFFKRTLLIIDILNLDSIAYHNRNSIYLLLSFCSLKVGNIIKGKSYFDKITKEESAFRKEEEIYYKLVSGLLFKTKEEYDLAEEKFEMIIDKEIDLSYKYVFVKAYYEYGLFLKEVGRDKKTKIIFEKGIKFCQKIGYDYYKNLMLKELKNDKINLEKINFKKINFDIDTTIEYVKQKKIMDTLYKKIDEIKFLNDLQQRFLKPGNGIEKIITKICKLISITFNINFIAFYIKKSDQLVRIYLSNDNLEEEAKRVAKILLKQKEEKLLPSLNNNSKIKKIIPDFNSLINLPLFENDQIIGDILIANQKGNFYLNEELFRVLSVASKQIATALINKKLELEVKNKNQQLEKTNQKLKRMASIDGLTKIANRKFFDKTLKQEWNRAKEENHCLALLMIDVDDFKSYNDNYGHQKGDECLIKLANAFKEITFSSLDLAARYGGDEFAIILPEINLSKAQKVAERIIKKVKELNLKHEYSQVADYVSLSIGGALAKPKIKNREEYLVKIADEALYKAKKKGSNCVVLNEKIIIR